MTIDWTSVLFQLANFALLIVLLRIFLYKPVLRVMDERAELTSAPLLEARRLAAEAAVEREALRRERASFEMERAERISAVAHEVDELRRSRMAELEVEAAAARTAAAESVDRSVQRVGDRLRTGVANLVVDEVRHALTELADADLDMHVWRGFEKRLRALTPQHRAALAEAARVNGLRIVTPRPLSTAVAEEASSSLGVLLGFETGEALERVSFSTDPDLLLGVVLEAGGVRLDGTASARLEALEATFSDALRSELS